MLYQPAGYHTAREAGPCTTAEPDSEDAAHQVSGCTIRIEPGEDYISEGPWGPRWCLTCGLARFTADDAYVAAWHQMMRDAVRGIGLVSPNSDNAHGEDRN